MKVITPILSLATVVISGNVLADSWTITQSATVGANTTILQENTSSSSVQAVNSINLNGSNGTVKSGSTQTFDIQENDLELKQDESASSSSQAINRVYANTIEDIQQSIATNGGLASKISLLQSATVGDNNTQSINAVITSTSGQVDSLSQSVSTTNHIAYYQQLGGESNIQSGNLIKSGTLSTIADNVTQTHDVEYASFLQSNSDNSLQAGNALLMISGQSGGKIKQEFSSTVTAPPSVVFNQLSTNGSVQSMNYAGKEL